MIDYKKLEFLRKHTLMNIVDYVKMRKMIHEADRDQQIINEVENCQIGVDYSKANEFEYNSRFITWMNNLMDLWLKHSDGLDLYEFANVVLSQNVEKEEVERNEIIRQRIK